MTTKRRRGVCHWLLTMIGLALLGFGWHGCPHWWSVPFAAGGMAFVAWGLVCDGRCAARGCAREATSGRGPGRVRLAGFFFLLNLLAFLNGVAPWYGATAQGVAWATLAVLAVVWGVFAVGIVGDYGYARFAE